MILSYILILPLSRLQLNTAATDDVTN